MKKIQSIKHILYRLWVVLMLFAFISQNIFSQSTGRNDSTRQAGLEANTRDSLFMPPNPTDSLTPRKAAEVVIEVNERGDTIIRYIYQAFDFGEIYTLNSAINAESVSKAKERKARELETASVDFSKTAIGKISVQSIDFGKSVGQISFDEGMTPSGGKTITIPILTATVASSTPQIALSYNSQTGNSMAGFGWSISGVPSISVTNKTIHYDGVAAPADISSPANCVFSLDGTRLVSNNNTAVPDYHYETAQGYTLVKKIMYGSHVAYFEALFPDGSKATFGFPTNTTTQISYPLSSIVDIKGYRMDFEYMSSGNMYFITKINYGSKTTVHPAEIRFEYTTRTDFTTAYISNTALSQNQLLKKIVSYNSGQEIRTYTLTHTLTNAVNRLTKLDCSTGTSSLNPLVFTYDTYPEYMGAGYMQEQSFGFIGQYFSSSYNLNYFRGKMRKNNFADGMLTYPSFSTYGILETYRWWTLFGGWKEAHLFGSTYSPTQTLLIVSQLDFFSNPISITTESGFQLLNTVDVNGDGIDEIVKVNLDGVSDAKTKTKLKITIYTLTSGNSYTTRTFNLQLEGVVNSENHYYSPISRSYYFGDFKGDGKVQLLTVSHNKTPYNQDRTSYFALIDLNTGALLSENSLFSHSTSDGAYVHTFDVNGDGKSELCYASTSGYNVYALSGNTFAMQYSSTTVPRSAFYKKVKFGDLNADGKLDILVPPNDSYVDIRWEEVPVWAPHNCPFCGGQEPVINNYSSNCRHCNQNLQAYYEQNPYYACCRECGYQLQPCNNDPYNPYPPGQGLCCPSHGSVVIAEINLGYVDNGNTWTCYINTGKGFNTTYQNIVNTEYGDKITVIDINRDGLSDLVQVRNGQGRLYLNSKGAIASTTQVNPVPFSGRSDLLPANVVNYYNSSFLVSIKDAQIFTYSFSKDESKANLLTSMTDSNGSLHQNNYTDMAGGGNYIPTTTYRSYPYASSVFPLNLLGSAYVSLPDYGNYISHQYYTYYGAVIHQQGLGFAGFEKIKTLDYMLNMESIETKDPEMFGVTTQVSSPFKDSYYYYARNEESNKQANPRVTSTSENDKLRNVWTSGSYQYDAYNNLTQVTQNIGSALTTVTTQTYYTSVTPTRFISGQPLVKTVTRTRGGSSWTDKEDISYDAATRLPLTKITYTGANGANKTGETRWTYDTNGNITCEKSAPYNVTEFLETTYTYDSSGRYVATLKNVLGQTTTYSNYDKFGNASTVTDHKSRTTTRAFDAWGQQTSSTSADGITKAVTAAWGGQGLYTVTRTVTGQPTTVVHYDAIGRELRKGNQRFDGSWQYVDNAYDSKGRLEKVSLPFKGSSPSYWNTYTYDTYNRPTKITEASGKTATWSYSGLSTTETKNGIATTKTADASGALVSVSDPGGTITYTLRPDGQPSSITAPGGVVTSFGYDAYGRQTSIADPSAGTQTFSDSYSVLGVLTRTVTDANNKTVTTVSDKYGRVTNVNRPEFNTSYKYKDDDKDLLEYELSTNATRTDFGYDSYDRLETVKESVPDGKWLKRTYKYAGGNIDFITYESQNGSIGTENFVYAYGHNTEIKLNNTTSIWKLTEENALGQPTKATTGTLARTYGYTAYGMPTGRTAGSIQNFTYNFDVAKGNLTSRTDNTRSKTESFQYDNLNRLTSAAGQAIVYAANGNITSIGGVGTLAYDNTAKPYQVTMLTPAGTAVPVREQSVTYTSYQRPNTLTENGITASFAYNTGGDRVKMHVAQGATALLTRYYIGKQYELDAQTNVERLYLGGDVYSAPAVYVKEAGNWKIYYICRDYLGSITHVANADGSLKQELSYDAWGRLRNPATQVAYAPGGEPVLFLGRGYTGHEHLPWFGLVNMNARLYDAALGRFLSPDPYVQAPNFTQNFNRYSYCLNNPLVYVDEDGEFIFSLFLGPIGVIIDGMCWGAVIGAGSGALSYTIGAAISGNWSTSGFWNAVGMGAVGGALGGGFGALGSIGALGSFGNTLGYNLLNQAASNALTNTMFGNEMTFGSVIGMAAGGLIGSALPNFKAISGGAFKNAIAEIGFNSGRGALTGLASGLVQAGIDKNPDAIWQNTLGGAIGGASSSIMNIATFGSAVKFDRANYVGVRGEQPVYRSGGIASLLKNATGISWGRTAWANKNYYGSTIDEAFAHEGFHYEQQKKIGFANFYGRTIREYAYYYLTTGNRNDVYTTPGNLEYGAMQNESMYGKLKFFLRW